MTDHTERIPVPTVNDPNGSASRMRTALGESQTFTRAQVADLMRLAFLHADDAMAFGYRAGVADGKDFVTELMLSALARPANHLPFSEQALRMEGYRRTARREADTAARHPWHGDYGGGGVPASYETDPETGEQVPGWPATAPDPAPVRVSTRVVRTRTGTLVWAHA